METENTERRGILQNILPEIKKYIETNYEDEFIEDVQCTVCCVKSVAKYEFVEECEDDIVCEESVPDKAFSVPSGKRSLADVLGEAEETFSQSLLRLISQKGLKDSDVYNKAEISRQHFSKIRNNPDYQPTKKTAFALAVAMKLNIDEALDLLEKAGLTFSPCKKEDLVVKYFIENENYDMFLINGALFELGLNTLT